MSQAAAFSLPSLSELRQASRIVHSRMQPTAQLRWPLLERQAGGEVWLKHENHAPTGAFKVRGGFVYLHHLMREHSAMEGIVTATRGNHGQSIALAAQSSSIPVTIVVPHGNSPDKNRAMEAYGAEVVTAGADFQDAIEEADRIAVQRGWHRVPSFHRTLVEGVGTWALELLEAAPHLEVLYVPIGMGSGLCGAIAARDALGLRTEIVGVCSTGAPAYARSLEAGHVVSCPVSTVLADGMACRTPHPDALAVMSAARIRIIEVSDEEIGAAVRTLFDATHNVAEGAGAAATAALLCDSGAAGAARGAVLTGQNIGAGVLAGLLEREPHPAST